jgi:HupE/UreJ protein
VSGFSRTVSVSVRLRADRAYDTPDVIRLRPLRTAGLLIALALLPSTVPAHDAERTQVSLTFARDGTFVLDVANDPDWLLLRLESFRNDTPDLSASARTDDDELRRIRRSLGEGGKLGRDDRLRALAPIFIDRIVVFVDGHEVRPVSAEYIAPALRPQSDPLPPLATYRLRGRMPPDSRSLRWFYGMVIDRYPLTIHRADGQSITEWVLGNAWSGALDLTGQFHTPTRLEIVRQYLALGYLHILPRGLDHILFVIGLFLLSVRLKPILLQVTTFTIAHSITLALTMYGIVSAPPRVVEPLIALSIAYVAVENLVTDKLKPWRLALVFSFGLLHGMGFAGVLRELGLPRSQFLPALVSFNAGVEGGQLTVIAVAYLCVVWYRQQQWYRRWVVTPASLLIAGVGLYWTVVRAMA